MEIELGNLYKSQDLSKNEISDIMDEISKMSTEMHGRSNQAETQAEKYAADIVYKVMTQEYDRLKEKWEELRDKYNINKKEE